MHGSNSTERKGALVLISISDAFLVIGLLYGLVIPYRILLTLYKLASDRISKETGPWVFSDPSMDLALHSGIALVVIAIQLAGASSILLKLRTVLLNRYSQFALAVSWLSVFAVPLGTLSGVLSLRILRERRRQLESQ